MSADPFTVGASYSKPMKLLLLGVAIVAKVEMSGVDVKLLRKPADALQRTELSDTQRDSKQQVPPTEILNDVACNPNPDPMKSMNTAPVDGKTVLLHEEIPGGLRSGILATELLLTIETREMMMPGSRNMEGDILAGKLMSEYHIVASDEENIPSDRTCGLESHKPNPDPTTVTREAAVTAEMVELA